MLTKMETQSLSSDEKEASSVWKNLASEYVTRYEPWPRQEKLTIRPPSNGELICDANASHDMRTMYDENFVKHPLAFRTKCVPPSNAHRGPHEVMKLTSTYDESYKKKIGQRALPFKPNPADHQFSKGFQGCQKVSVNQETYRAYSSPEAMEAKRKPIIIEQGCGVMPSSGHNIDLTTTVQDAFRLPDPSMRRSPIIPKSDDGSKQQTSMELMTTNRADFTVRKPTRCGDTPGQAFVQDKLLARLRPPQDKRVNFCSTFQNDYISHANVSRPKSFKPVQQYQPSETPFNHETVYDYDFRETQGIRPSPWKPEGNLKVRALCSFQDTTQYRDTHCLTHGKYTRPPLAKPKTSTHGRSLKFLDDTSYKSTYQRSATSQQQRTENFKPVRKYQPPMVAFTAESTAHAHYRGDPAPPSKICKPVTNRRIDVPVIPLQHYGTV